MSEPRFDPYALLEELDREKVSYVVIGGFARVVHGSAETTRGLDIAPSLREENLRRLARALEALDATAEDGKPIEPEQLGSPEPLRTRTRAGELMVVPTPWGTRGYDDLRIRSFRDNLGRGVRPSVASVVDCRPHARSQRTRPGPRTPPRLRRLMELERQLVPQRQRTIER